MSVKLGDIVRLNGLGRESFFLTHLRGETGVVVGTGVHNNKKTVTVNFNGRHELLYADYVEKYEQGSVVTTTYVFGRKSA